MQYLIASNNAHKQQELREIFDAVLRNANSALQVELVAPVDLGIHIDPDESASTYAGNALLKARAFAAALRRNAPSAFSTIGIIADDSGLEVDALGGAPGLHSSRYHQRAPGGDGCAALLREMRDIPDEQRAARFQCVIALIAPDGSEHLFTGACPGHIGHEKRGSGGFGFDPVFLVGDGARSMAELAPLEKHRISHRGVAARMALAYLTYLAGAADLPPAP